MLYEWSHKRNKATLFVLHISVTLRILIAFLHNARFEL
jgi:hypothetical protein